MIKGITFLILAGKKRVECEPVQWLYGTREAMICDLLDKLRSINLIDRIIISSNDEDFLRAVSGKDSRIIADFFPSRDRFQFSQWLCNIIKTYKPERLFYWGSGASPFMTPELLDSICNSIITGENILYTNNFFSADWVAFTPAASVLEITPPPLDNNLAYYLWRDKGIRSVFLAPSVEIVGDVDTPTDLLILSIHPRTGPHTLDYLRRLNLDTSKIKSFANLLSQKNEIFLAGRVGSALFRYIDTRCFCKFRVISEERGMKSSGRLARGEARSFVGEMIERAGMETFFAFIEETSQGAVLDSRVIFAHVCKKVGIRDRFYSDLGQAEAIENPFVAEFTRRVQRSPIPILVGGHSLILGGLWALVSAFGELPALY